MIVTMAYDEDLANRIRELIASEDGYTEQKMFGGIGFMIDGHMAVGVSGEGGLMIHCSKEETEALLAPSPVRDRLRGADARGRAGLGLMPIRSPRPRNSSRPYAAAIPESRSSARRLRICRSKEAASMRRSPSSWSTSWTIRSQASARWRG